MFNEIMSLALGNGLWAALFCLLFLYQLKDSRAREKKYACTVDSLTKSLSAVREVKRDCTDIAEVVSRVKYECESIKADTELIKADSIKIKVNTEHIRVDSALIKKDSTLIKNRVLSGNSAVIDKKGLQKPTSKTEQPNRLCGVIKAASDEKQPENKGIRHGQGLSCKKENNALAKVVVCDEL